MFSLILVGALIAQTTLGAPTNDCVDLCDNVSTSGYGGSKSSSYSSYSKSSNYQRIAGGSGLGRTGSRLENLDENVIGTAGLDRPGTWQDEKHYVTDDGKGEMSYRAGQTVTNNGYSKFAQHSYRYGTHDSHAPLSNSQVLSTAEFERELQSMRNRISSFMGNFHLEAGSLMNANRLEDFKTKASLISNQLTNVCNQVDVGSSMYQQMQQMLQQFNRDVEQKQREFEAMIFQSSSSSQSSTTHGSSQTSYPSSRPQYIQQYPQRPAPSVNQESIIRQRVEEQLSTAQNLINTFYSTFSRADTNLQYQADLNAQTDVINQKLIELSLESVQSESQRMRIDHLKKQFEQYVTQIRTQIQQIEERNREEEERRKEREFQLQLEKQRHAEKLRQLEEEAKNLRLQQEEEKIRLQKLEEDRQRLIVEQERVQREQEAERLRQKQLEEERLRLKLQQERIQQEQEEHDRLVAQHQLEQQQHAQKVQQVTYEPQPQVTSTVEVSGSYQHNIQGSYGSQVHGSTTGSSGSYIQGSQSTPYTRPQGMQPHIDLTAAVSRLQQDLNRLQNEVNNFNMFSSRLTSANSASLVTEAEAQAEILRQRITNLCETSNKYQNQNILTGAENLRRRLEEVFSEFQRQAANFSSQSSSASTSGFAASAGYSSHSSYGTAGKVSQVHAPSISNVEYEHSKSTEVEVGRRPAQSQRLSSGASYSANSGYSSSSSYGSHGSHGANQQQVECVEKYAGQPCIEEPTRYRRNVGEIPDDVQRYRNVFDGFHTYDAHRQYDPYTQQLEDYGQQQVQPIFDSPDFSQYSGPVFDPSDLSQYSGPVVLPREPQPIRNYQFTQPIRQPSPPRIHNLQPGFRAEDLTRQSGEYDEYYSHANSRDGHSHRVIPENSKPEQDSEDFTQQHTSFGRTEDLETFDKPREHNVDITHHVRDPIRPPTRNLEIIRNTEEQRNRFNHRGSQHESLDVNQNSQQVQPIEFGSEESTEQPQRERPITIPGKMDQSSESDHFTLEKSGFDNYPESSVRSQSTEQTHPITPVTGFKKIESSAEDAEDFTLQKSGFDDYPISSVTAELQNPQKVQPISTFEKPRSVPDSDSLTLQNNGFNDYPKKNEKPITSENSLRVQPIAKIDESEGSLQKSNFNDFSERNEKSKVTENSKQVKPITAFGKIQSSQESEFTLEKSGFNDDTSENKKQSSENPQRVQPLVPASLELSQQTEDLSQQQSNFESSSLHNEKLDDLTQQSAGQIEFGAESQVGRQFSSQKHPTGQYIGNLSHQNQQPTQNIQKINSNNDNQQLQNINSQTEKIHTPIEYQGSISTLRPTNKPAPKPVPRYTRPWQVSHIQNIPKKVENEQKLNQNENVGIDQYTSSQSYNNQFDFNKHSASLRGDIPGESEPTTPFTVPSTTLSTTPLLIEEKVETDDNQKPYKDYDFGQQYEQVDLHQNSESPDLQKPRSEWSLHNREQSQINHSGQAHYFNQQNIHGNYEYSQQSNYHSQHISRTQFNQQVQNPSNQQNSNVQFNHQLNPTGFNQEKESLNQFHELEPDNLQKELLQQSSHPKANQFEQTSQLQFNRQEDFSQQHLDPLFDPSSRLQPAQQQEKIYLQQQTSQRSGDFSYAAEVVPLDNTRPMNEWSERDLTTTPPTFWKKIGHKLSNSFDKAKEKAKTIFG